MLIEQIDTLSAIASAFSDFAQMPKARKEVFSIKALITRRRLQARGNRVAVAQKSRQRIGEHPPVFRWLQKKPATATI